MAFKLINATEAKSGSAIVIENAPCIVRNIDISKTGKHGHAKARIEAIGIFDGKKRIIVIPGTERLEVPLIEKKKAQVMAVSEDSANVMDLESFETFDIPIAEEVKGLVKENENVEYWNIDGIKIIKRKV